MQRATPAQPPFSAANLKLLSGYNPIKKTKEERKQGITPSEYNMELAQELGSMLKNYQSSIEYNHADGIFVNYYETAQFYIPKKGTYAYNDVLAFCAFVLPELQGEDCFGYAGVFLSALINSLPDGTYNIPTSHMKERIPYLGSHLRKGITLIIGGHAGSQAGYLLDGGTLIINGNALSQLGFGMKRGTIHLNGQLLETNKFYQLGPVKGGDIFQNGKQIVKDGERM